MTHLLPSKSSTLKQKRLIKKYRDRSLRLLEKINPSEKRGVYHQSEAAIAAFFAYEENVMNVSCVYAGIPLVLEAMQSNP